MNKTLLIVGGVVVVLLVFVFLSYNSTVTKEEAVSSQWGNVQNSYQRRADLIPNLVSTVKGVAEYEKSTLEAVVNARAKATSVNVNAENLTPENIQKFNEAQSELSGALSRLLVTIEKYPDLKATQNFSDLQSQLEATENRINVERRKFNEAAQSYNAHIRRFPAVIYAGIFGFEKKAYFESDPGAEKVPNVDFSK